jgi:hypothetical protein
MPQKPEIKELYFLPPLAIARLGASTTPLDSFIWQTDQSIHGGNRTVISPAKSFRVMGDGSVRPFLPNVIQFRDGELLRPVAPFFELWANVDGEEQQVNQHLLDRLDVTLESVKYTITVGNRKAQRRTGSAACAYIARVSALGDDHEKKSLLAFSPHNSGEEPLVSDTNRIPLGHFQVIRPINRVALGVDLSALRVRFTPAAGEVYGPRIATTGPASPLPPGQALAQQTLGGRLHEIVKPENRILNPSTKWTDYVMDANGQQDPQPSDSYDGANVGGNRSWGVVDDTCDGIIEAQLVVDGVRYVATARVLSSCPDFAPDRRPVNSFADDLADRDNPPVPVETTDEAYATLDEIADLFERAFETASLINLDANRYRGLNENLGSVNPANYPDPPLINFGSMTARDVNYADLTAAMSDTNDPGADETGVANELPYSDVADFRHQELCDIEILLDFFQTDNERVRRLVRPAFGRLRQLREKPESNPLIRDPRIERDQLHDMRMPPYMRDCDALPLSITRRQYDALMQLLDKADQLQSPIDRRIQRLVQRRR